MTRDAFIFDAIRTPRGRGKSSGALYEIKPIDLVTQLLRELQRRNGFATDEVDDIILGCVTPIGDQGANLAKTAALYAGYAETVAGQQINRFCASGLEAVNHAAMRVRSGWEDLVIGGGVESMSRVPMGSDGGPMMLDPKVSATLRFVPQGIGADLIATLENFSREDVDAYALRSHQRAAQATANGYFQRSLIPVTDFNGMLVLDRDEHIRPDTTLEALAQLKPSFAEMGGIGFDAVAQLRYPGVERIRHVHTAGNSSGIVDGAALVLVGSREKGEALGLKPRARIVAAAVTGSEPTIMLTGPLPATRKALAKAGMTTADIDLFEVNEAFASVVLKFARDMDIDPDKINVNGGAIAMGHPLGATGAMLLGTALDELERRQKATALITLCVGGGMGIATIIERV
ncbi:acetyl-CoA C-acetyltransferase [Chloracidobacterium aggregatum]|jgi:acetyl-CoA C-acetyltransferase|uniref:acetyl-CoA C-acetyltransferase n=1 Tax=Chloracidobacterium aggregatum TaxID=2851959 RepID=UPI001B8B0D58|nr:acetyl-CoA C-acetyltransferase [Chloracidobacterium aggregatum]QUV86094.1 acetyl-CoA C-acetyltransferase [Chloracidobacterium sp. 2]QUV89459.1 acetyl-CoA C-acetyltransferase [Chloracidobacterium sp. S]QUV92538.1 acetyl-CoA C-acetyltransferase [Chloracidobacterium sp. A]QUV98218.1 acetyl-CoA C-acetyltransferase [Chloracidobacterium sp. E]